MPKKKSLYKKTARKTKKATSSLTLAKLKLLRKEQKLTLEKLSKLTEISPSYLSRLETGARRFNTDILEKLSTVLGCHPSDLLELQEDFSPNIQKHEPSFYKSHRDLPIYKTNENHKYEKRFNTSLALDINFEKPSDWAYRPWDLRNSTDAFAVFINNQAYAPKYVSGETLFIHPTRPLTHGCCALAIKKDQKILIGQFEQYIKGNLLLREFNESKRFFTILHKDLKTVYRIIGVMERP